MSASPVRRCVAVAGHGKRCQQSPFRGSPYCWHHLQSRKVPAPSRPLRVAPLPPGEAEFAALQMVDKVAFAARLARTLSTDELATLVQFVEDRGDGTLLLTREDGRITEMVADRTPRTRRAASSG